MGRLRFLKEKDWGQARLGRNELKKRWKGRIAEGGEVGVAIEKEEWGRLSIGG